MSRTKLMGGSSYTIPEDNEAAGTWGADATSFLDDVADLLNAISYLSAGQGLSIQTTTSSTLAASATLTPVTECHRVQGSGGAVTLDATTAIADGVVDGQLLELEGDHATNTVTIQSGANVTLNGDIELGIGEAYSRNLMLRWNDTLSTWVERGRDS